MPGGHPASGTARAVSWLLTTSGETDVIDIDETISALAKTVADLTYGSDAAARQRIKDDLMRDIAEFETDYEQEPGPGLRH